MRCDYDGWNSDSRTGELILQLEAGHLGHLQIQHEAIGPIVRKRLEKKTSRWICPRMERTRRKDSRQGFFFFFNDTATTEIYTLSLHDALLNGKSPGQPCKLNDLQRRAIAGMIESGPIPAVHGVVRWRLIDLAQWIFEEFRITIAKQTLSRELRAMGYRKLSARPRHHAQAQGAIEDFKKAFPCAWRKSRAPRRSTATR